MADNQYKRRTAERVAEHANDDPLAELARVVGYDPRGGGRPDQAHAFDSGPDLEEELLRELRRTEEDDLFRAQEFTEPALAGSWEDDLLASVQEFHPSGGEDRPDAHEHLFDEIGFSLEDELMRELQGDQEPTEEAAETVAAEEHFRLADPDGEEAFEAGQQDHRLAIVPELIERIDARRALHPVFPEEPNHSEAAAETVAAEEHFRLADPDGEEAFEAGQQDHRLAIVPESIERIDARRALHPVFPEEPNHSEAAAETVAAEEHFRLADPDGEEAFEAGQQDHHLAIVPELIERIDARRALHPVFPEEPNHSEAAAETARDDSRRAGQAEIADESGGFAFPSEDELEEDEQFTARQWNWSPEADDGRSRTTSPSGATDDPADGPQVAHPEARAAGGADEFENPHGGGGSASAALGVPDGAEEEEYAWPGDVHATSPGGSPVLPVHRAWRGRRSCDAGCRGTVGRRRRRDVGACRRGFGRRGAAGLRSGGTRTGHAARG